MTGTVCSCDNLLFCLIWPRYLATGPIRRQVTAPPDWSSN
jgi:hypothetical protein